MEYAVACSDLIQYGMIMARSERPGSCRGCDELSQQRLLLARSVDALAEIVAQARDLLVIGLTWRAPGVRLHVRSCSYDGVDGEHE